MTYDEFMSAINSDVERILDENSVNVAQSLLQGLSESEPCVPKEQFQIIRNAVNTSIRSSVQIMFDYLDSLGMLEYEHLTEHHEPPDLRVIQGGRSDAEKK